LRQVIVNLAGNAIKFTERGEVVVSVEVVSGEPSGERPDHSPLPTPPSATHLHFAVRDTGIGIPLDKREKVFEAFTQADTSTTRRYGGTGLGLTISSQLVGLMGGRIWLESEVGRGSTFHFTARFGLSRAPRAKAATARPVALQGLPVLVVDDNATNRRILQEVLTSWGMRPTVLDSGPAALDALARAAAGGEPFPLALLDSHMPELDGFGLAARVRQRPELAGCMLVMLTSAGLPEDIARCQELGINAYLMKPVKQSELLATILTALGGTFGQPEAAPAPVTPPSRRHLHVLLAEDNPVNQKLAVRLLEKQGHRVTVAATGGEALTALEREAFDLVLMDVQMPELDGLEATARIRAREQGTGRRVPIIAMTAHAMKGDRERCLEAGMDAYVSKPIQPLDLVAAMRRVVPSVERTEAEPVVVEAPNSPLDMAQALNRVGRDVDLLRELVGVFLDSYPAQLAELREALARQDSPGVRRMAHTIRGAAGNFGAGEACAAAERLEAMGRAGELADAPAACAALEEALDRLRPALAALRAGVPVGG
jgi:CheY-like chemotaxis protein